MLWLIWKQQRKQFLFGLLLVAAYVAFTAATGFAIKDYHKNALINDTWINIVRGGYTIPILLGMFWGAPLISSEYDSGTNKFIWTQGISRRKWLLGKLGITLVVAGAYGLICSFFASWWFSLQGIDGAIADRFSPPQFGLTGLSPILYALFAVALGAALGAWLKKPVPSIATTLVLYSAVFFLIAGYIRPHYMTAYQYTYKPPTGCVTTHVLDASSTNCAHIDLGPSALRGNSQPWQVKVDPTGNQTIFYQPGNRYWRFQLTEAGIYLGLTIMAASTAYTLVLRRDA